MCDKSVSVWSLLEVPLQFLRPINNITHSFLPPLLILFFGSLYVYLVGIQLVPLSCMVIIKDLFGPEMKYI